jgi:hypothetical protein
MPLGEMSMGRGYSSSSSRGSEFDGKSIIMNGPGKIVKIVR